MTSKFPIFHVSRQQWLYYNCMDDQPICISDQKLRDLYIWNTVENMTQALRYPYMSTQG